MENTEDYCNILSTLNKRVEETEQDSTDLKNEIGFQEDWDLYDHYKDLFGLKNVDDDSELSVE
jgi:hypothetical protein